MGEVTDNHPEVDLFQSIVPFVSEELEKTVQEILRSADAHVDLADFISGQTDVASLTHRGYENFLGLLYTRRGYRSEVTRAVRDGGFDVIAFSDDRKKKSLLIQAKHTQHTVGISIIRELIGARYLASDKYADFCLVVATTGKFSKPARQAERTLATELQLIDYKALLKELRSYETYHVTDIVARAMHFRNRYEAPLLSNRDDGI